MKSGLEIDALRSSIYAVILALLASLLIVSSIVGQTSQEFLIHSTVYIGDHGYICGNYNSTHYYARNWYTGNLELISTSAAQTISYALSKLTPERTWPERVILRGNFIIDRTVDIYNVGTASANITLDFSQATITSTVNGYSWIVHSGCRYIIFHGGTWIGGNNPSSGTDCGIVIYGQYCTVDGADMSGFGHDVLGACPIFCGYASAHNTIQNCVLHDNGQHILLEGGVGYHKVLNCTLYNSGHSPIYIAGDTPNNEIAYNEFRGWSLHGMYVDGALSEEAKSHTGGNLVHHNNFHDANPEADAISCKTKNNKFYDNDFADVHIGLSIHSQYDTAEANDNEIYNNNFTRVTHAVSLGIDTASAGGIPQPTSRNRIHDNVLTDVVDCFLIGGFNNNPGNLVDETKIYYNTCISCTNIFPTASNSGQPAMHVNDVIAYNNFGKTVPAAEVTAVESWTNPMITGNTGLADFNPVYDPSSPYFIPPP